MILLCFIWKYFYDNEKNDQRMQKYDNYMKSRSPEKVDKDNRKSRYNIGLIDIEFDNTLTEEEKIMEIQKLKEEVDIDSLYAN